MEVFKGKEFTFTSEWLRRRGLQGPGFKAWLTYRKKGSLIYFSTNKFDEYGDDFFLKSRQQHYY